VKGLPGPARLLFGHGLDLAAAPAEDWTLLPGIGPARAASIVAERARGARFERPEDLERVHGIGPGTVERLRPWLGPSAPPLAALADGDSPPPSLRRGSR
jgi:competence protein ComEA